MFSKDDMEYLENFSNQIINVNIPTRDWGTENKIQDIAESCIEISSIGNGTNGHDLIYSGKRKNINVFIQKLRENGITVNSLR